MNPERGTPVVELRKISKQFGAVQALVDVDFSAYAGEIVALVGDNGAGKSTLIRIIVGIWQPTSGEIFYSGEKHNRIDPRIASRLGIQAVHQDFGLVNTMTIERNVFLGSEPYKAGLLRVLDRKRMIEASKEVLDIIGMRSQITPSSQVATLSGGEIQAIKIGRAVYYKAKLIILDEPTNALSVRERHRVVELTQEIRDRGVGVIFISHDIHQVYGIADRILVMERGRTIGDYVKTEIDVDSLVTLIREGRTGKLNNGSS